jgi:hypothetical protein
MAAKPLRRAAENGSSDPNIAPSPPATVMKRGGREQ